MKKFFILIAFCAQAIAGLAQTKYPGDKGWQPGPPAFGAEIEKDVRIPMEDGVVLDAKVAYPTSLATGKRAEETFPVLMMGYAPRAEASMGGNEGSEKHFADFDKAFWAGGDPAYDGTFWQDRIPLRWSRDIVENGIPVLQWGGWQDLNETGAVRGYVAFQNAVSGRPIDKPMQRGQKVSPRYQLIIGDWGHGLGMGIGVYLEWFDTWLKGKDTGLTNTATPLHLYEAGSERWVNLAAYPAVDTYTTWYLGSNESIARRMQDTGENRLRWGKPEEKDGKLTFESAAITNGMTIAGPLSLQLYAKSSNTNMEILARLYDVAPDGTTTVITKGAMLGSLSKLDRQATWTDKNGKMAWPWPTLDKDVYLMPNEVQRFDMALEPIQYGLRPGHKLCLGTEHAKFGRQKRERFPISQPRRPHRSAKEHPTRGYIYHSFR